MTCVIHASLKTFRIHNGFRSSDKECDRAENTEKKNELTYRRVVNVQRLGRHELAHQRRLAHSRGTNHGYAKRLGDSRTAGTARFPGRRQRRASAGPGRAGIRTASAAHSDHGVIRRGQVFGAVNHIESPLLRF